MKLGQTVKLVKNFSTGNGRFKKGQLAEFIESGRLSNMDILKFKTGDGRSFTIPVDKQEEYFKIV